MEAKGDCEVEREFTAGDDYPLCTWKLLVEDYKLRPGLSRVKMKLQRWHSAEGS